MKGAFQVSHTIDTHTHGIWMDVVEHKGEIIVLLDAEGWSEIGRSYPDVWFPLILMFISSEVVINVKYRIQNATLKDIGYPFKFPVW